MIEPGDFATRSIAMKDALLGRAHDDRLRYLQRCQRFIAIASCDCFLDLAHEGPQVRAPRLVDLGAARDLAGSFTGRTGIGHSSSSSFGTRAYSDPTPERQRTRPYHSARAGSPAL